MSNFEYEDDDDDFTTPVVNQDNDLIKQLSLGFKVEEAAPAVDPAVAAANKRMGNAMDSGITPDSTDDIMRKLMSANSREELDEVIRNSGL